MQYTAEFAATSYEHIIYRTTTLQEVLRICATLTGKEVSIFDQHQARTAAGIVVSVTMKDRAGSLWDKQIVLCFKKGPGAEIRPPLKLVVGTVEKEEEEDYNADWFGG